MCNLYSITKGPQAIRDFVRAVRSDVGNMPPLPGVFPDYKAPIVRGGAEGRELVMARWGMPSPVFAFKGRKSDPGVTNIRNVASPHWRRWLGVESRCVVPFQQSRSLGDSSFSDFFDTVCACRRARAAESLKSVAGALLLCGLLGTLGAQVQRSASLVSS
jgi:hypothetical protein